jgi:hypothetical protein
MATSTDRRLNVAAKAPQVLENRITVEQSAALARPSRYRTQMAVRDLPRQRA